MRLGALAAGPLAAACSPAPTDAGGPPCSRWRRCCCTGSWSRRSRDFATAAGDPVGARRLLRPAAGRAAHARRRGGPHGSRSRPTRDALGGALGRPAVTLARGWERQLDRARNPLFYGSGTLDRRALPRAGWRRNGDLLRRACPTRSSTTPRGPRRSCWPTRAALPARALALAALAPVRGAGRTRRWPARRRRLTALGSDSFTLALRAPGQPLCVCASRPTGRSSSGHGLRRRARRRTGRGSTCAPAGRVRVGIDFALGRIFEHGPRCRR